MDGEEGGERGEGVKEKGQRDKWRPASLGLMVTGGSPFLDEPQKKRRKEESTTDLKDCRGPKVWHD